MKVQEVRDLVKDYDKKTLENIIIELYKNIPKYKKECDGVDVYLKDAVNSSKKSKDKGKINFEDLADEIITFLSQVQEGLYSKPNKFVSKEQRTKWRFKVKNYYKVLSNITPDSENGAMSTKLLIDIYTCLSRGTYYLAFSNFETFRSIGVMQTAYFNMLANRILYKNTDDGSVRMLVRLVSVSEDSSWFEEKDLKREFMSRLKKILYTLRLLYKLKI